MLNNYKSVYFIGIKGVGMTMLAQFMSQHGVKVQGSDIKETFMTDEVLQASKIKVLEGFNREHIKSLKDCDLIVYSSAYTEKNNIELKQVLEQKEIPVKSYAQALAEIFNNHKGLAVCGSHGKTTVSAWTAFALKQAKLSPQALIGARVPQLKGSSLVGKSELLIIEADEYQNKLQHFQPKAVILTNIDWDHHDYFTTFNKYLKAFSDFVKKIPASGFLIYNYDDLNCRKIAKQCQGEVIGFSINQKLKTKKNVWQLRKHDFEKGDQIFSLQYNDEIYKNFKIKLLGRHNLANAISAIATGFQLGAKEELLKKGVFNFKGTARRQEIMGRYRKALLIDDYGHHPTEIKSTLEGLRQKYEDNNLTVVFHPHTYTRTKALLSEFSRSFYLADKVLVVDIYGSAREEQGGISSYDLVKKIQAYNKKAKIKQEVLASGNLKETTKYLANNLEPQEVAVLMGAGDVFRVGEALLNKE
ncbi:MAG: UDP-N-acetylmuramate--L-alanine ligase [Candidatus Pacebacteria bacterium]|nr:UDP-N-acetylmuramate--L-alanine ligase [Candidatus Paceibacterota bacterium]